MKRNALIVLAVLVALLATLWLAGLVSAGRAGADKWPLAGAPNVVSYQGQVIVAGSLTPAPAISSSRIWTGPAQPATG